MSRYNRAAAIGYSGDHDSPFAGVPDWLRKSNAARGAFEIGSYLARAKEPLQGVHYIGGRARPVFGLADGRCLSVSQEYPGVRIRTVPR